MANGIDTASVPAWYCKEQHERTGKDIDDLKATDKEFSREFNKMKESLSERMRKMETKVAKIMGGIGVLLVLVELLAKYFAQ